MVSITKEDVLAYYTAIADVLLPHLRNRPLSFKRYPGGVQDEFFWEKDAPGFTPAWVPRFPVPRRGKGEDPIEYIVINNLRTLKWVVDAGGIELHPFLHTLPRVDLATHLAFDLDPGEGADILDCARVALLMRDALNAESFAKVSGSKGIQVYVPLDREATHAQTEAFARTLAGELARRHPGLIVAQMTKSLRRNRVFIDWSQNADYKTMVAVYSLRATGLVSMPVRWEELERPRKLAWTPSEAIARVKKLGDIWSAAARPPLSKAAAKPPQSKHKHKQKQTLPKSRSQSGRRLFVLTKDELRLEVGGKFRRWSATAFLGEMDIDPAYYRGEKPVEDTGAYEVIEGSMSRNDVRLFFSGKKMTGEWRLKKTGERWSLSPISPRRGS